MDQHQGEIWQGGDEELRATPAREVIHEEDQECPHFASMRCVFIGSGRVNHGGRCNFSEDATV
jgi:hypothetical protein